MSVPPTFDRAAYAKEMLARYDALDRALVARGFPPTSPWWREQVRRYFESGCRQVVLRVGRRGGKSSTLCRIGVVEALYGRHVVPPGDVGTVAIVSVDRREASKRLRTIATILDAIGVPHRPVDGGIELEGLSRAFVCYTASISGVSGFTGICVICDEVAKWKDADTGANPATEVLASVRPTMATMPLAKILLSSSPMGKLDAHAAAFDEGESNFQLVAWAPSWVANPTLTEDSTHELERNEDRWRREYAAVPMEGSEESLLSAHLLDRATRPTPAVLAHPEAQPNDLPREPGVQYVATMDPALVRNAWTFALSARRWVPGPPLPDGTPTSRLKRSVILTREWRGSPQKPLRPDVVLADIAKVCRRYGVDTVHTDQFHGQSLAVIAERPDINLTVCVWPANHKGNIERYETLLTWLSDDEVEIPNDKLVRADLLAVRRVLTPNGFAIRLVETPDGRHCDHAPTIAMGLAHCYAEPDAPSTVPGTPEYLAAERDRLIESMGRSFARRGTGGWGGQP